MKSFKYLSILILPITVYISFTSTGLLTFLPLIIFFGFVPSLELLFKPTKENFTKEEEKKEKENKLYTGILYLMIPIQFAFLAYFFVIMQEANLATSDMIGRLTAMGLICGVIGINVGHELGHRNNRIDEFFGELLLLTCLNTHFLPYHNAGHHLNVATPKDAATARKNELLYLFWIRSHFTSYVQAWQCEYKRLTTSNRSWFHPQNRMIIYSICNLMLLGSIYYFLGTISLFYLDRKSVV